MKKSLVLFALATISLASCSTSGGAQGGSQAASSDESAKAKQAFSALRLASEEGLKSDSFGMVLSKGKVNAAFSATMEGEEKKEYGLRVEPCAFDLRMAGLNATSFNEMKVSLLGKTSSAKQGSRAYLSGDELFTGAIAKDGLPLTADAYLQDSVFYLNLYDMAVLRRGVNEIIKSEIDPDFEGFPARGHYTFSAEQIEEAEKELPLGTSLREAPQKIEEELLSAYASSSESFSFASDAQSSRITFSTTSWDSLETIVNAFDLPADIGKEDIDNLFAEAKKNATLNRCVFDFEYSASHWDALSYDLCLTFKDGAGNDRFAPIGEWTAVGRLDFSYGEDAMPVSLSEKDIARYQSELAWPNFNASEEAGE